MSGACNTEALMARDKMSSILERLREKGLPSPEKARKILEDGEIDGRPLTPAQKRLFGLIASGKVPTKLKKSA